MSHLEVRLLTFLILNSGKYNSLYETKNLITDINIAKTQGIGKRIVTNLRASGTFSLLTSLSHALLTPGDGAPRKCRASPQSSPLTGSGTLRVLIDPRAMDTRGLTPQLNSSPPLWETKTAPMVGISSKPQLVSVSECTPFFVYVPLRNQTQSNLCHGPKGYFSN